MSSAIQVALRQRGKKTKVVVYFHGEPVAALDATAAESFASALQSTAKLARMSEAGATVEELAEAADPACTRGKAADKELKQIRDARHADLQRQLLAAMTGKETKH